jgi:hypothetical protein
MSFRRLGEGTGDPSPFNVAREEKVVCALINTTPQNMARTTHGLDQTSIYSGCPVSSADSCGSWSSRNPGAAEPIAQPKINGCLEVPLSAFRRAKTCQVLSSDHKKRSR